MTAKVLFLSIVILAAWFGVCAADQSGVPQDIRSAFESRSYEEVITLAGRFLAADSVSLARYDVAYLGGEAAWKRERWADARAFLSVIANGDPEIALWSKAALLLARVLEAQKEPLAAAAMASRVLSRPVEKGIAKDARKLLEGLAKKSLPVEELSYIAYRFPQSSSQCWILERLADAEADARRWEELWNVLDRGMRLCGKSGRKTWEKYAPEAFPHAPAGPCKDPYLVGVAVPLQGVYSTYGESMARGAFVALEEHNRLARFRPAIVLRDTEGDPVKAVAAARDLCVEQGVVCVVGGLLSSSTVAIAGVSTSFGIPLLSPSATREEIAGAGPRVFQSTLPRSLQVRALASAARERLKAEDAVVLYPETPEGELLSSTFARAFESLGGEVTKAGYAKGERNFGRTLTSAMEPLPDCLFLAGSAEDLTPLIPQLAYYDIDIPVLSTEAIASAGVAELARRHLGVVLYASDSYTLAGETETRFSEAYEAKYGETPDRFAARGYLAVRLVAGALESGARSRGGVAAYLQGRLSSDPALRDKGFIDLAGLPDVTVTVTELSPR
jgi:branched-chain amino acid transport system substrate-binding protein